MLATGIIFFIALAGIVGLFGLKAWEEKTGRVLAPEGRATLDREALRVKVLLEAAQKDADKLPLYLALLGRFLAHRAALGFAHLAQQASKQAHRLADMVSHKHNFERRETRSEFLKKVSEFKNGASPLEQNENI